MAGVGRTTVTAASTGSVTGAAALVPTQPISRGTGSIAPMPTQHTSRAIDFIDRFTHGTGQCIAFIGRLTHGTGQCIGFIDRSTLMEGTSRGSDSIGPRGSGSRAACGEDGPTA